MLDEKLREGDLFRESRKTLETTLKNIEARCKTKKKKIAEAYHEYYLSERPGRWDSNLLEYRHEIEKKFSQPEGPNLEEIHALFQSTFREYMQSLLIYEPDDDADTQTAKSIASDLLEQGKSTNEVLQTYFSSLLQSSDPATATIIRGVNESQTAQERAQIYISAYCTPSSTDTPQQKTIKQKYARFFEQLVPHDEVLDAWTKEAAASQDGKLQKLQNELSDLELGQNAHMKAKVRKAEKAEKDKKRREPSPKVVSCEREGCPLDVDISGREEIIECAICEWLERNGRKNGRAFYCSFEHCEEDGEGHEGREHQCWMGEKCSYYPEPGPNEADGASMCGLCPDCRNHQIVSYFCSEDCYRDNIEIHRDQFHGKRDISSTEAPFDKFQPAIDMEVLSIF